MSRSVNKVILIGNVGKDPEFATTSGGTQVAKFSLATGRYKGDETDWHRVTVFGKLADVVRQYVHKGDRLYVEGRLQYSQTEKDGVTRYWTDVIVHDLTMLGGQERREAAPDSYGAPEPAPSELFDSDLPF